MGEFQLIYEHTLPEETVNVGYGQPTFEESGKLMVRKETIRNNERKATNKLYRYSDQSYFVENTMVTTNKRRNVNENSNKATFFNLYQNLGMISKREVTIADTAKHYYSETGYSDDNLHDSLEVSVLDLNGNLIHSYNYDGSMGQSLASFTLDGRQFQYRNNAIWIIHPNGEPIKLIDNIPGVPWGGGAMVYYNFNNQDMILNGKIEALNYPKQKLLAVIDGNNNLLWKKRIDLVGRDEHRYIGFSMSGNYFSIIKPVRQDRNRLIDLEIVNRIGSVVAFYPSIKGAFGNHFQTISEDDKYFISSYNYNSILVYDLLTGELINTFKFSGGQSVKQFTYNGENEKLYVLFSYPSGRGGGRYLGIYPIDGNAKNPFLLINIGEFDLSNYMAGYLSVSGDGNEVTVRVADTIKTYQLTLEN